MENSPALTEAEVYEVLRECYDPEIPVNIVDLGLIYGVSIEQTRRQRDDDAHRARLSDGHDDHAGDSGQAAGIPGCDDANVEIIWDPPWTPHMMSEAARKQLGLDD